MCGKRGVRAATRVPRFSPRLDAVPTCSEDSLSSHFRLSLLLRYISESSRFYTAALGPLLRPLPSLSSGSDRTRLQLRTSHGRPIETTAGMIAYRFSLFQTRSKNRHVWKNCTLSVDGNRCTALGIQSVPDSDGRRCRRPSINRDRDLDRALGFHRSHADGGGSRRLR